MNGLEWMVWGGWFGVDGLWDAPVPRLMEHRDTGACGQVGWRAGPRSLMCLTVPARAGSARAHGLPERPYLAGLPDQASRIPLDHRWSAGSPDRIPGAQGHKASLHTPRGLTGEQVTGKNLAKGTGGTPFLPGLGILPYAHPSRQVLFATVPIMQRTCPKKAEQPTGTSHGCPALSLAGGAGQRTDKGADEGRASPAVLHTQGRQQQTGAPHCHRPCPVVFCEQPGCSCFVQGLFRPCSRGPVTDTAPKSCIQETADPANSLTSLNFAFKKIWKKNFFALNVNLMPVFWPQRPLTGAERKFENWFLV